MTQQFHFWVYNEKDWKQGLEEINVHYVHSSNIHIAKTWKQPKCTSMDKWNVVYTYNGILFNLQRKEILLYAITWMDLEDIMLSE